MRWNKKAISRAMASKHSMSSAATKKSAAMAAKAFEKSKQASAKAVAAVGSEIPKQASAKAVAAVGSEIPKQASAQASAAPKSPEFEPAARPSRLLKATEQRTLTPRTPANSIKPSSPNESQKNELEPRSRSQRAWYVALSAGIVGLAIGVATFSVSRLASSPPQAEAILILDASQVGWPFYQAAHEVADELIASPDFFEETKLRLEVPEDAISLVLEPTSDLSTLIITGTANSIESAIGLTRSAATSLAEHSRTDRRFPAQQEIDRLDAEITTLTAQVSDIASDLDSATSDSEQVRLRADLTHVTERLNSQRDAAVDARSGLVDIGSSYILVGEPMEKVPGKQSLLASLSAGAGAAILALLMLSVFTARDGDR